nr:M20/M25/M40 family metallo-hydrolase [Staphylococcus aureus]
MTTFSEKEKIKLLADIVELQTENNNEINVCNYLKDLFDKYDIKSEILKVNEHRANIVAEIGNGSPILALSGHMDVVDAGNQDNWTHPPFQLTEKDGNLYGRGTTDMKGGLMALVISLIELKEQNQLPQGTIRLLATAGEEKEQEGAKLLADKGYLDDVDGLIIAEPTGPGIYYAHKGSMSCKVTAIGKAVHSSVPFIGDNAIDTLLEFYNQFKVKYSELKNNDSNHELDVSPMFKSMIGKDDIFVSALVGATDASSFLGDNKNNVDLAIFGPGNPLMAHQIDEYIEKDMYLKYIDIFKEASIKYLKEK